MIRCHDDRTMAIDFTAALERRDQGVERAAGHANRVESEWTGQALGMLIAFAKNAPGPFLIEQARAWAEANGLPLPPDQRSWGAVTRSASAKRRIVKVGEASHREGRLCGSGVVEQQPEGAVALCRGGRSMTCHLPQHSVVPCARCAGNPDERTSRSGSRWLQCDGCGSRTPAYRDQGEGYPTGLEKARVDWGKGFLLVPKHQRPPGISARSIRGARGASTDDGVLELLARMLVSTSYRVPVEGRSTRTGLTTSDVAAAVGYMRGRLPKAVAIAVVTRAERPEIARLSLLATPRIARHVRDARPVPLSLGDPASRWRLRLVAFDAAYELVWPERRQPYGELARLAKMRKQSYIAVHRCATHVLQEALNAARSDLKQKLSGG